MLANCIKLTSSILFYTGDNVKDLLEDLMMQWGLDPKNLVCVTSDCGSNMVKAINTAGWQSFSCIGHVIHNAVNTGLGCDKKVESAIAACKSVGYQSYCTIKL